MGKANAALHCGSGVASPSACQSTSRRIQSKGIAAACTHHEYVLLDQNTHLQEHVPPSTPEAAVFVPLVKERSTLSSH